MNQKDLWEKSWHDLARDRKDTPPEFVWERIESALPSKKKRPLAFIPSSGIWWISSLSIMVLGIMTALLANQYIFNNASSDRKSSTVEIKQNYNAVLQEQDKTSSLATYDDNENNVTIAENEKQSETTLDNTAAGLNQSFKATVNNRPKQSNANSSRVNAKTPEQSIIDHVMFGIENEKNNFRQTKDAIQSAETEVAYLEKPEVVNNNSQAEENTAFFSFAKLSLRKSPLYFEKTDRPLPALPKTRCVGDCPSFTVKDKIHYFINADAGLGIPFKNMETKSGEQITTAYRKKTETPICTWSVNLLGGIKFNRHFSLATGVQWQQHIERFYYNRPGLIIITINPGVDTTIERRNFERQTANTYNYLDIPLLLTYEMGKKKWELGIETGPFINLRFSANGLLLEDEDLIKEVQELQDYYRTRVGIGLQAGVSLHRLLDNNWSIYMKPNYRHYFGSITAASNPLDLRFQNIMVQVGLRKIF